MAETDIPTVVLNQTATPEWANLVAAGLNNIDNRTTALEALNAGSRLTTAEADIDALEVANNRQGIWWQRTTNQSIPGGGGNVVVTNTATVEASAGFSVASGVVTIPAGKSGVYNVFAKVSSGGSLTYAWITVDDSFDVTLTPGADRGGIGHFAGTASLRLNAGQNVRLYVRYVPAGSVNVTGVQFHLWRVSA